MFYVYVTQASTLPIPELSGKQMKFTTMEEGYEYVYQCIEDIGASITDAVEYPSQCIFDVTGNCGRLARFCVSNNSTNDLETIDRTDPTVKTQFYVSASSSYFPELIHRTFDTFDLARDHVRKYAEDYGIEVVSEKISDKNKNLYVMKLRGSGGDGSIYIYTVTVPKEPDANEPQDFPMTVKKYTVYTPNGNMPDDFGDQFDSLEDALNSVDQLASKFGARVLHDERTGNKFHIEWLFPNGNHMMVCVEPVEDVVGDVSVQPVTEPEPETLHPDDELYAYALMRTDIPDYNSGKACAQVHHSGTKMTSEGRASSHKTDIETWEKTGGGFGVCIVLDVNVKEMRRAVEHAQRLGLHANIVHDPSYPIWDGERIHTIPLDTCAYVFGKKNECQKVLGQFDLLRDK